MISPLPIGGTAGILWYIINDRKFTVVYNIMVVALIFFDRLIENKIVY